MEMTYFSPLSERGDTALAERGSKVDSTGVYPPRVYRLDESETALVAGQE